MQVNEKWYSVFQHKWCCYGNKNKSLNHTGTLAFSMHAGDVHNSELNNLIQGFKKEGKKGGYRTLNCPDYIKGGIHVCDVLNFLWNGIFLKIGALIS